MWLKVIVCLCMLFPTSIAIGLYVYLLSIIGTGNEPERVIGLLGAATWTASCGVYLSSRKFYYAAALFAITSVVTYSS